MANTLPQQNQRPWYPWLVWGLAVLFYFYEFLLQVSPGVMVADLMKAFNVNAGELGNLAALYFYIYAGIQIPVGILLDKFGPRYLLTFAAITCAIGSFLFGSAEQLALAGLGRMLIGLGSAFAAISCLKLAANWFPANRFALLTGLTVMVGMLGAINGQAPLALLVETTDWRNSMHVLGLSGIILAIYIYLIVRDSPPGTTVNKTHLQRKQDFWQGLRHILRNKQTWATSIYGGLIYAPTTAFAGLWGVPFLMSAYHLSRPTAAGMISFIFIGWAIGSPLWGWLSDRWQRRKPPLIIAAVGALLTITAIIYINTISLLSINILLLSFGLFSAGFLPAFSIVKESNSQQYNATALGFINTLNMVGGAVAQPLIGYILDYRWTGLTAKGIRAYQLANFHVALLIIPIMLGLALLTLPFIKETYGKSELH